MPDPLGGEEIVKETWREHFGEVSVFWAHASVRQLSVGASPWIPQAGRADSDLPLALIPEGASRPGSSVDARRPGAPKVSWRVQEARGAQRRRRQAPAPTRWSALAHPHYPLLGDRGLHAAVARAPDSRWEGIFHPTL